MNFGRTRTLTYTVRIQANAEILFSKIDVQKNLRATILNSSDFSFNHKSQSRNVEQINKTSNKRENHSIHPISDGNSHHSVNTL